MVKQNAPDLSAPSSRGPGSVCVGDNILDTYCSLEAPRSPRSEAQAATFENARANRAANRAAETPAAPAAPAGGISPPIPPISLLPEPALTPAPAAAPPDPAAPSKRKSRSYKGGERGYLVRENTEGSIEGDFGGVTSPGYTDFVIV